MPINYTLTDSSQVASPALLFYKDLIEQNLKLALKMAGTPSRLRPHAKTHKTREIARLMLDHGITKHKCATLAEAEMLAQCGALDILLAYPMVGPNCRRLGRLAGLYPRSRFSVLGDHADSLKALSDVLDEEGREVEVLLDLDVGQERTGIPAGPEAVKLYELIGRLPALKPGGLHVYDGHNRQETLDERKQAVKKQLEPVLRLREDLEKRGLSVPRIIVGGTPTFPAYAALNIADLECSPGTCFLHDYGYGSRFADLAGFVPAALLITRVISRPTANRVTFDLGYKAVSSDPPAGQRCHLLDVLDYKAVLQNEEHLVIETPHADKFTPGDVVYAIPTHICPTVALHKQALIVENGQITGAWDIIARDRFLTV